MGIQESASERGADTQIVTAFGITVRLYLGGLVYTITPVQDGESERMRRDR